MRRIDQSDFIIHFTKGKTNNSSEQGYENFKKILADGKLIGGNFMIRGEYKCVCFTESPIRCLVQGKNSSKNYLEEKYFQRYRPFGFQFSKKHIHQMGGRQVIYSTDNEYLSLPENFKWRFMHHEHYIDGKNSIDFTWEREWRLKEKLIFNNKEVNLVFPNRFWIDRFITILRYGEFKLSD